ncbi:MAG: hypothetical protein ABIH23_29650 [bacterium]
MTSDELTGGRQNLWSLIKPRLPLLGTVWFVFVLAHFLFINPWIKPYWSWVYSALFGMALPSQPFWAKPLWTAVPAVLVEIVLRPGPFLFGLIGVLVSAVTHAAYIPAFGIVGWVYVTRRLPERNLFQKVCLAVLMGIILVGIPLHFLGSIHFLGRWQTLAVPIVVIGLIFLLPRRAGQEDSTHENETNSVPEPKSDQWIAYTAWGIVWLITLLTFYHAVGFPVEYWDALIYYTDYAQRSWEQGGFPTIVCGQVGIGLGANYPHLFHVLQVLGAHIAGGWSDLYGQLLPPVLGVVTLGLLAGLLRNLFANGMVTALGILVFRSIPYGVSYQIWVSDYSLVMACTAGFFLCIERFLYGKNWRWYEAAALICAAMPTINYLGWIYFPIIAIAPFLLKRDELSLNQIIRRTFPILVLAVLLAIPWYIRNITVTGNPVYAFFHNILDGKRIDSEVMASCQVEWLSNGDGPGQLGRTLAPRLILSPWYFLIANPSWKLGPLFIGLLIPGLFFAFTCRDRYRIFALMLAFTCFLFIYEYVISGLYLYHALGLLPVYACFAMSFVNSSGPVLRRWLAVAVLLGALCPGLSFALMGPKLQEGKVSAISLPALRYGPLKGERFQQIRYPEESPVWSAINTELEPNAKILTHENRYHLFRRDITLVHLDDWDVSRLYGQPFDEIMKWLNENGVRYYLRIKNESNHPILKRLGHNEFLDNPTYFQESTKSGNTILYRIIPRKEEQ